jgi:hypothetical protein
VPYREFEHKVINPAIYAAHKCKHLFFKSEGPLILAIQAPLAFHNIILETDYNRTSVQLMPLKPYPVIPCQSAGILIQGDNIAFIPG